MLYFLTAFVALMVSMHLIIDVMDENGDIIKKKVSKNREIWVGVFVSISAIFFILGILKSYFLLF